MEFVDITELTVQLLVVSGVTKVLVDLTKIGSMKVKYNGEIKQIISIVIAVLITLFTGISLFEATPTTPFYIGCVAAGIISALGSNVIHELMKALASVKELKKR